jgi:iron complex outermembrane receptor protein
MKNSPNGRRRTLCPQPVAFKLSPVAAGCAALLFVVGSAYAQQAEPAKPDAAKTEAEAAKAKAAREAKAKAEAAQKVSDLGSVTVTGIRRGIENAIALKKESDSIIEAISAEDIGKLPDVSIAESIARLPGASAQRVEGRAQTINFRGMSGDFAGTLLNGREQVSTSDNRGVEFDQYPSELINTVLVYKTPDAMLVGQGLSATVDMQTVRPLAFGKRTMAFNLRGEHNSMGSLNSGYSADGARVSASYIDQFADRTLGVALGFAHLETPGQAQRYEAWGYTGLPGSNNTVATLGGSKQYADSSKNTRDGLLGVLEWKPTKNYTSMLDLYYSKFDEDVIKRGLEAGTVWGSGTLVNNPAPTIQNGFATQTMWTGVKPVLVTRAEPRHDKLFSIGWNNKLDLADWHLDGDLSYSRATRKQTLLETYAGAGAYAPGGDTLTQIYGPSGTDLPPSFTYGLNYTDPGIVKLSDPGGWGQDGYVKYPDVKDELKAFRADAKHDIDWAVFNRADIGVNYTERQKDKNTSEYFLRLKTSPTAVPGSILTGPTSLAFVGIPGVLGYDPIVAMNSLYNLQPNIHSDIYDKVWTVKEKVTTLMGKLGIDSQLMSMPLRGNIGLQVIHADQRSVALSAQQGAGQPVGSVQGGTSYTDVLPSLNLAWSLPYDQTLRLGLAKVVARPRMDQMGAWQSYSLGTSGSSKGLWSGTGGNPDLKPWRSTSFDLAWEKYFGSKAYLSVAGFYKNLSTYIYNQVVAKDFSGYTPPPGVVPVSNIGGFTQPVNGQGGRVSGVEVTASVPFNLFAPALDGFGAIAAMAYVDSSIQSNGPGSNEPLPGLSRTSSNITLYYEKYGFSARISERRRSQFNGEVYSFDATRQIDVIKPEAIVDVQVGYDFESGSLKGLGLLLQVNNLNNAAYRTQFGAFDAASKQYTRYGRSILFGLNYKL